MSGLIWSGLSKKQKLEVKALIKHSFSPGAIGPICQIIIFKNQFIKHVYTPTEKRQPSEKAAY